MASFLSNYTQTDIILPNLAPIKSLREQFLVMLTKHPVFRLDKLRVVGQKLDGGLADLGNQSAVFLKVADEHFDLSRLPRAARLAWTTQFEVDFSDFKAIIGAAHGLHAGLAVGSQLVVGDEDTIGLVGTASHTAT